MSRRAVQTEVNAKGNRSPGWILGSAVKAYLYPGVISHVCKRLDLWMFPVTLLAGLALNFSNSFCDCDFVARLILNLIFSPVTQGCMKVVEVTKRGEFGWVDCAERNIW